MPQYMKSRNFGRVASRAEIAERCLRATEDPNAFASWNELMVRKLKESSAHNPFFYIGVPELFDSVPGSGCDSGTIRQWVGVGVYAYPSAQMRARV